MRAAIMAAMLLASVALGAQQPLRNPLLQTDLDGGAQSITNLQDVVLTNGTRLSSIGLSSGATVSNILCGAGSSTRLSVSNGAGPQVTLNFDASGLATGAPIYSVSGLATGTPLYSVTQTGQLVLAVGVTNAPAGVPTVTPAGTLLIGTNVPATSSGSETQGMASVLSIGPAVTSLWINTGRGQIASGDGDHIALGENSWILGGGAVDSEELEFPSNFMSRAVVDSMIWGGNGNSVIDNSAYTNDPPRYNFILGGHGSEIVESDTFLKYNTIVGGNSGHIFGGVFNSLLGQGGMTISNADLCIAMGGGHGFITGLTNSRVIYGTMINSRAAIITNSYCLVSAGGSFSGTSDETYTDAQVYRPHETNGAYFGFAGLWLNYCKLFSAISTNNLTNAYLNAYATATNSAAASDGQVLTKRGGWLSFETVAGGSISHVTEGSGNVVTQIVAGGSVVTARYGTVTSGGGGGPSYTRAVFASRWEGSSDGGFANVLPAGMDTISTDAGTNVDAYSVFVYTAAASTTNTIYGTFIAPNTNTFFPFKFRADQASGTFILTASSGSASQTSTQIVSAAFTTYTTNMPTPAGCTNFAFQIIYGSTGSIYRAGIGQ